MLRSYHYETLQLSRAKKAMKKGGRNMSNWINKPAWRIEGWEVGPTKMECLGSVPAETELVSILLKQSWNTMGAKPGLTALHFFFLSSSFPDAWWILAPRRRFCDGDFFSMRALEGCSVDICQHHILTSSNIHLSFSHLHAAHQN